MKCQNFSHMFSSVVTHFFDIIQKNKNIDFYIWLHHNQDHMDYDKICVLDYFRVFM